MFPFGPPPPLSSFRIGNSSYAQDGDTVVIHSMDRMARNLHDLRSFVKKLTGRGASIEFVKEYLAFTGDDSPMAMLLLSMMGAFG